MIVLDASAAVDLLLDLQPQADWVRDRLPREDGLHAPHLIDVEVGSAMRRRCLAGEIPPARGRLAMAHLTALPMERYAHGPLTPRIWELHARVSYYDAVYVALAEALDLVLVTTDRRLGRAGFGARVAAFNEP